MKGVSDKTLIALLCCGVVLPALAFNTPGEDDSGLSNLPQSSPQDFWPSKRGSIFRFGRSLGYTAKRRYYTPGSLFLLSQLDSKSYGDDSKRGSIFRFGKRLPGLGSSELDMDLTEGQMKPGDTWNKRLFRYGRSKPHVPFRFGRGDLEKLKLSQLGLLPHHSHPAPPSN